MDSLDILFMAIQNNDVARVESLLVSSSSIHVTNVMGMTPLHQVAYEGHQILVKMLLDKGADPNRKDYLGTTPLHHAAYKGHYTTASTLLNKGANPNQQGSLGGIPLHEAAFKGPWSIVELLLSKNAKVDLQNTSGESALHRSVDQGHDLVVEILLSKNSTINLQDGERDTPLHKAARAKQYLVTKMLLEKGATVDGLNKYQETPLHLATAAGDEKIVALLLQYSPLLNIQDHNGNTPLHHAAWEGFQAIVTMLLNHGAALNLKNRENNTPLHEAAQNDHANIIKLLLEKGAGIYPENAIGNTIGYENLARNPKQIVHCLLPYGVYGYKHSHADQVLSKYLENIQINNPADLVFYTRLLVAGVRPPNTSELPEPLAEICHQINATIIQWLAPLKLSKDINFLKAVELVEVAYREVIPSILRALPRLVRWADRINKVEKIRQEAKKQGYRETLEEACLISSVGDPYLEAGAKKIKESTLERLQVGKKDEKKAIPTELLLPFRDYFIQKALIATLLKIYKAIPREVADYLVAQVLSAPDVCTTFYTRLFQHLWPTPCEAPMTPAMQDLEKTQSLRL